MKYALACVAVVVTPTALYAASQGIWIGGVVFVLVLAGVIAYNVPAVSNRERLSAGYGRALHFASDRWYRGVKRVRRRRS